MIQLTRPLSAEDRDDFYENFCREVNASWQRWNFDLWLDAQFRCTFCEDFLLGSYEQGYYAQTDHLLPKKKTGEYAHLENEPTNWVLACARCNFIKGQFVPDHIDEIYDQWRDGNRLTERMRAQLIAAAKSEIARKRADEERLFGKVQQYFREMLPEFFDGAVVAD